MTVNYVYQEKNGKMYSTTFACTDEKQVYEDLLHELISKKINACTWIKSIKRRNLYNGFQEITVSYDHGGRRIYQITDH